MLDLVYIGAGVDRVNDRREPCRPVVRSDLVRPRLAHLAGTPYLPDVAGGILFLEDVGEHPYRVERMLYQLLHAGTLSRQRAILLGAFTEYQLNANDAGYDLAAAVAHVRERVAVPIYTGLPFGHVPDKLTLPVGGQCEVEARDGRATLRLTDYQV